MYLYMNECNDIYFLCPFIFFFVRLSSSLSVYLLLGPFGLLNFNPFLEDNDELLEDKELLLLLLLPLVLVS